MAIGDLRTVSGVEGVHYLDVGLYDTPGYGSVYLVEATRPAVVDTGLGRRHERIVAACEELDIDLDIIAPTHVHLDHAGGVGHLAQAFPGSEVVVHESGARHLVDPSRLVAGTKAVVGDRWRHYGDPIPVEERRVRSLTDGDIVDLGDRELRVHHAPGHAPHQVVYELPDADAVFTADAAGIYVPRVDEVRPTTPPVNFDLEQSLADLEHLADLDPATLLYGHFGPASTDDRLDEAARTVRNWVDEVAAARERLGEDDAVVERFVERATERAADDGWDAEMTAAEVRLNTRGVLMSLDAE